MKSCNFTEMLKAQKLKISCRPSSNKIFYYFEPWGFGIAEYNDRPIIEKKWKGGGLSRKMDANPEKLSPLSWICLKKLWHVWLNHSLIHHFETVPNSKKLQMTSEMWLLKGF